MAIGFERYIAVVFPLRFDKGFVQKKIAWIVVVEFVVGFLPQYAIIMPTTNVIDGFCVYMGTIPSWTTKMILLIVITAVQFFVPLPSLIFIYSHMAIVLGRQKSGGVSDSMIPVDTSNALRDQTRE